MPFSGGDKLKARLAEVAKKLSTARAVQAGFPENRTYPGTGASLPAVAAIQEFGGTVEIPEHETTVYRKTNATGDGFLRNGKFVKARESNFATDHVVPAHTVTIPARPFFRTAIRDNKDKWGQVLGQALVDMDYDAAKSLEIVGDVMRADIQGSIEKFSDPPNAPSTIRRKGKNTPLIDTGFMLQNVDYVVDGDE